MAYGKWIGAAIGAFSGGVLGALAGYAIGSLFDKAVETGKQDFNPDDTSHAFSENERQRREEEARNGFLFSLMVLSAHIIQADGKIMHSEMETVRRFLRNNFGSAAEQQGNDILLRLFDYRKQYGEALWNRQIHEACLQMRSIMPDEHRLQLLAFLAEIIKADGTVHPDEVNAIRDIASLLGFNADIVSQFLSLGGANTSDAYKVLGISPDATDEEVRKAYRDLVKQNHPDRVATLGEDIKVAAQRKMQEINEAKEKIFKERGM